jgi:hypothetical protein
MTLPLGTWPAGPPWHQPGRLSARDLANTGYHIVAQNVQKRKGHLKARNRMKAARCRVACTRCKVSHHSSKCDTPLTPLPLRVPNVCLLTLLPKRMKAKCDDNPSGCRRCEESGFRCLKTDRVTNQDIMLGEGAENNVGHFDYAQREPPLTPASRLVVVSARQ